MKWGMYNEVTWSRAPKSAFPEWTAHRSGVKPSNAFTDRAKKVSKQNRMKINQKEVVKTKLG